AGTPDRRSSSIAACCRPRSVRIAIRSHAPARSPWPWSHHCSHSATHCLATSAESLSNVNGSSRSWASLCVIADPRDLLVDLALLRCMIRLDRYRLDVVHSGGHKLL